MLFFLFNGLKILIFKDNSFGNFSKEFISVLFKSKIEFQSFGDDVRVYVFWNLQLDFQVLH